MARSVIASRQRANRPSEQTSVGEYLQNSPGIRGNSGVQISEIGVGEPAAEVKALVDVKLPQTHRGHRLWRPRNRNPRPLRHFWVWQSGVGNEYCGV